MDLLASRVKAWKQKFALALSVSDGETGDDIDIRYQPSRLLTKGHINHVIWFEDVLTFYGSDTAVFDLFLLVPNPRQSASILKRFGYQEAPIPSLFEDDDRSCRGGIRLSVPGDDTNTGTVLISASVWRYNLSTVTKYASLPLPPLEEFVQSLMDQWLRISEESFQDHCLWAMSLVNLINYCYNLPGPNGEIVRTVDYAAISFGTPSFPACLQNLFVDSDLNITCVIDWAFSSLVPPAQLLATPGLPHPRDLILDSSLVNAFRSGFENVNREISEYIIEPDNWKIGQMVSHFMRLVHLDSLQDMVHLDALYALSRGNITPGDNEDNSNNVPAMLAARAMTEDALVLAGELAADEEPKIDINRQEEEYFSAVGAERLELARKVAFAAKMNPRFVADGRLWRWIDAAVEFYKGGVQSDELQVV